MQPEEVDRGNAKKICDIVRMILECDTVEAMAAVLGCFSRVCKPIEEGGIEVVRFKDRMNDPAGGWRDAMINFRVSKSAHICEVQIVHKKMYICRKKDGFGGHDVYTQKRNAREILEYLFSVETKKRLTEDELCEARCDLRKRTPSPTESPLKSIPPHGDRSCRRWRYAVFLLLPRKVNSSARAVGL